MKLKTSNKVRCFFYKNNLYYKIPKDDYQRITEVYFGYNSMERRFDNETFR